MKRLFWVVMLVCVGVACKHQPAKEPIPPLKVQVARAVVDSLPQQMQFIGYLQSNFDAVIQPRINGFLLSKRFENGMPVRRGDLLFTIDPSQFSNTMMAAEAELHSAKAEAVEARNNYDRAVPLAAMNAISRAELDQYTARHLAADAAVRSAEQSLKNARLNVGYTKIYAPIDGIASGSSAHVGDYVGPGTQFDVLTTISNIDTLSVDLAIPMGRYLRVAGERPSIYDNDGLLSDIRLWLADELLYPLAGVYNYTRKDVSASSGTIVIVVSFPNPRQSLKPGQFARVTANVGAKRPLVVVPASAVSQAQGVDAVWVVNPDSTVAYRRVVLGPQTAEGWVIESGVSAGEWVVGGGRIKLRDGAKVNPQTTL